MNYQHYKIEDFLADEDFKQWVLVPDEKRNRFWQSWLNAHPEKEKTVLIAKEIILTIQFKSEPPGERYEQALSAILKADKTYILKDKNKSKIPLILKIAASVIFIISSIIIFYLALNSIIGEESFTAIENIIKTNPAGVKTRIILPDSTQVYLNSETTISYPSRFTQYNREVTLSGEAFFEVTENAKKPFIVKTGNLYTTALGTSFNISTFPGDSHVQVSLVTGKVKISTSDSDDELYLDPGYQALYNKKSDKLRNRRFSIEKVLSWKNGVLYFNKENLKNVVAKLERWYGVDILVNGNPPADFIVSGQFHKESLDNVLETMRYGRYFNYTIQNKTVTLDF